MFAIVDLLLLLCGLAAFALIYRFLLRSTKIDDAVADVVEDEPIINLESARASAAQTIRADLAEASRKRRRADNLKRLMERGLVVSPPTKRDT